MSHHLNLRIAACQFEVRNLVAESSYWDSLDKLVVEASKGGAQFLVFPEYFTAPLLSTRPEMSAEEGIELLASEFTPKVNETLRKLSADHGIWIVGGSQPLKTKSGIQNVCFVFGPNGEERVQPKLHITPCETEAWAIAGGDRIEIIETAHVRIGVQICYDVEFPEVSRMMADAGVDLLFVPYCTDDDHGHLRVNLCARARAIENQIYVVSAGLCGTLEGVPNVDFHYAESAAYTPCDLSFARTGIAAKAKPNEPGLIFTDLDLGLLRNSRAEGTVTPRSNRRTDLFDFRPSGLKVNHE